MGCCAWEGLACDNGSGSAVTCVWLPSCGLGVGSRRRWRNLTALTHLNRSGNSLIGTFPAALLSFPNVHRGGRRRADGQLERIVLDDTVEVGPERDGGDVVDGLGFGEVECAGVHVGEEDIEDVEWKKRRSKEYRARVRVRLQKGVWLQLRNPSFSTRARGGGRGGGPAAGDPRPWRRHWWITHLNSKLSTTPQQGQFILQKKPAAPFAFTSFSGGRWIITTLYVRTYLFMDVLA